MSWGCFNDHTVNTLAVNGPNHWSINDVSTIGVTFRQIVYFQSVSTPGANSVTFTQGVVYKSLIDTVVTFRQRVYDD